jgi:hypothetical protein
VGAQSQHGPAPTDIASAVVRSYYLAYGAALQPQLLSDQLSGRDTVGLSYDYSLVQTATPEVPSDRKDYRAGSYSYSCCRPSTIYLRQYPELIHLDCRTGTYAHLCSWWGTLHKTILEMGLSTCACSAKEPVGGVCACTELELACGVVAAAALPSAHLHPPALDPKRGCFTASALQS